MSSFLQKMAVGRTACSSSWAAAIRAARDGQPAPAEVVYPGIADGLDGMRFIDACLRSSAQDAAWVGLVR